MFNYWVVGAMFGGNDDKLDVFIKRGYWYCWEPEELINVSSKVESLQKLFKQIQPDDRIAVKKMLGQGSTEIQIRALGIVTDVDFEEWRIYVNWVLILDKENPRKVPIKGAAASIHGPFDGADSWIQSVFHI